MSYVHSEKIQGARGYVVFDQTQFLTLCNVNLYMTFRNLVAKYISTIKQIQHQNHLQKKVRFSSNFLLIQCRSGIIIHELKSNSINVITNQQNYKWVRKRNFKQLQDI